MGERSSDSWITVALIGCVVWAVWTYANGDSPTPAPTPTPVPVVDPDTDPNLPQRPMDATLANLVAPIRTKLQQASATARGRMLSRFYMDGRSAVLLDGGRVITNLTTFTQQQRQALTLLAQSLPMGPSVGEDVDRAMLTYVGDAANLDLTEETNRIRLADVMHAIAWACDITLE